MSTSQKIIKYCAAAFGIFLAVSIIGGILGAVSSAAFLFGGGDASGELKTYEITDTVKELEIDLKGARLEIRTGRSFLVESNDQELQLETKNGVFLIRETSSVFGFHSGDLRVVLTIPEEASFDRARISAGAGTVKIETLSAERLSLDLGAGEADIDRLFAYREAKINGGAGELKIRGGELVDLDLDMGVGAVDLESRLTGNSKIDYGIGELHIVLIGTEEEYRISLGKGAGRARIGGVEVAGDTVYGSGDNTIAIGGGLGDLDVTFEKEDGFGV